MARNKKTSVSEEGEKMTTSNAPIRAKTPKTGALKPPKREIDVKVSGVPMRPIGDFEAFQGDLKTLTDEAKEKLKESIRRNGFNDPIDIWAGHDYILDGHQRITAVKELIAEGWTLPDNALPYVEIHAKDEAQAAEIVLTRNSQYGKMIGIGGFIASFKLDAVQLGNFMEIDMPKIKMPDLQEKDLSDGVKTESKCPKCGYEW